MTTQTVIYLLPCAAMPRGCASALAIDGPPGIELLALDLEVSEDKRVHGLITAAGWRLDHGKWVCPNHPFTTPAGPVTALYWPTVPTPEEAEVVKRAVLETAAEVAREQQAAGQQEACCVCGSPQVGYHNYRNQPFCWPCADGEPLLQVVHVVRTEGPTSEVFAGPFTGDEAHAWIEANRTDHWTMCQVATLQRPVVVPERERLVHENPELAAQIREGITEAERGETADLGSFAQYLDDED